MSSPSSAPQFLRRRNALWLRLRQAEPGTPVFETLLSELSAMIGWNRERVLAGLGLGNTPDAMDEREED